MSIATLKKKSKQFKLGEGISGRGKNGFSLNGGLRNQGWVGQGVRGRHLSRTLYRGLTPVGNGGCCGTYPEHILSQPNCSVNDPNIIKRSAMNTPGYIAATVVNPTSVFNGDCSGNCQKKWVSVYTQIPDYSIYIATKAQAAMFCDNVVIDGSGSKPPCKNTSAGTLGTCNTTGRIGGKKRPLTPYFKDMRGAQDASWWNESRVYYKNCLPPPLCKAPWPTTASRKCKINYLTPEEAVAAGALPPDWMNCLPGTRPGMGFESYTNNAFSSY